MNAIDRAEADRLAALRALNILDTPEEGHFDSVCRTARRLFGVPHAVISLIDADRQWLKTACTLVPRELPRTTTFCDHTIRDDAVMVVPDATEDPRFADADLVVGAPHLRFYAGAPLVLRPGVRIGALCLLDTVPHDFSAADAEALQDLAEIVLANLRLHEVNALREKEAAARTAHERVIEAQALDLEQRGRALALSEVRYRQLAEAFPMLVWTSRLTDGRATFANAWFHEYCGPIGMERGARQERVHPDERPGFLAAWSEAAATLRNFEIDCRIRRHDDVYRWHKVVMTPIPLADGGPPLEWLGTALDIDEIVTARQRLEETSRLLSLAQEAAEAGAWDWDMRSGITTLAPESVRLYGLPGEGPLCLPAASWTELLHPDDRIPTWDAVRCAVESNATYTAEYRIVGEGAERWMRAAGRVLYDEDGRPYRIVGFHFDVTERKRGEAALNAATQAAEAARREAERASEAKSQFLAAMSHEIRTPLNGILGYADLLLEGHHSSDDRRKLELIQSSGAALLTVVNDILDFSKIEAGQLELDPIVFPLRELLDNTLSIVSGSILKSPLRIEREIDPDLPSHVLGDESRLRQVLLNLLNNAVKFTPSGSVTLRVGRESRTESPDGEVVETFRFSVIDTGIGIPRAQHGRLFQRFSQVDGSISRRFGGSGLGLAICRHLVTMMGGRIGLESEEGVGSTFWFTLALPRRAAPSAAVPAGASSVGGAAETVAAGVRARVLLVEDVKLNQELARAVLEVNGYHVDVAGDGADAVRLVAQTAGGPDAYDVVLMDIQMPGMDGLTATGRIRTLGAPARDVPIVAMTANVLPAQIAELRAAGLDDHVGKPFKRAELYAAVDRWTGQKSASGEVLLDRGIFDTVREQMGADGIRRLLTLLETELGARFEHGDGPGVADLARLAHDAHAMVSAAGILGFVGMAQLCREIEAACREGQDLAPLLRRLDALKASALRDIEALRAA